MDYFDNLGKRQVIDILHIMDDFENLVDHCKHDRGKRLVIDTLHMDNFQNLMDHSKPDLGLLFSTKFLHEKPAFLSNL